MCYKKCFLWCVYFVGAGIVWRYGICSEILIQDEGVEVFFRMMIKLDDRN